MTLDQLSDEPALVSSGAGAEIAERDLAAFSSRNISSASNTAPTQIAESAILKVGQL
jgi:hypothetical protein